MNLKSKTKLLITGLMLLISIFLTVYLNIFHQIDMMYSHFYYLPIMVSGIWYHKKAIFIGMFLGLSHVSASYISAGEITQPPIIRLVMFVVIAAVIGTVSQKRDTLFNECIELEHELLRTESLRLLAKMAGTLAHEIRNPITTVSGLLQLYRNREVSDKQREEFDIMIDELNRANLIISEYLSFGKDNIVQKKYLNINTVINYIYPLIRSEAAKFRSDVKLDLGRIPDLYLDESQIRQLLFNLVNNGLDAMPKSGEITITTYAKDDQVVLAVADQGEGISSHIIDKIPTPFCTTKENGTGLGLAVCYQIALTNHASIDFKTGSTGTVFFVRFKLHNIFQPNPD